LSGYVVLLPDEQVFGPPSWSPAEATRSVVELRRHGNLSHSQANLWRYPPGARGRRHREPLQEEVFCVLEGTLTLLLGEPAERYELPPRSVAIVEPRTAVQLRNDSSADVVFFAYGAPHQASSYEAEILDEP
jgi:quercetin dioxygenase-like cupin family protein